MKQTSNPAVKKFVNKFYYKKPSISYEVTKNYNSINLGRKNSRRAPGMSKTRTLCDLSVVEDCKAKANRSVMNPPDPKPVFTKKNSLRVIGNHKSSIASKRQKYPTPQVNKLSPRSLMNTKSKEILYKTFMKEFKACTEPYSSNITKEDLYTIMRNMHYFVHKTDKISDSDLRHIDYIFRI